MSIKIEPWDWGYGINKDGKCISDFYSTMIDAAKDYKTLEEIVDSGIEIKIAEDYGLWAGGRWFSTANNLAKYWRKEQEDL